MITAKEAKKLSDNAAALSQIENQIKENASNGVYSLTYSNTFFPEADMFFIKNYLDDLGYVVTLLIDCIIIVWS